MVFYVIEKDGKFWLPANGPQSGCWLNDLSAHCFWDELFIVKDEVKDYCPGSTIREYNLIPGFVVQ